MKRLIFEERQDSVLFRYLEICYGVAIVGTDLIGQVWTAEELQQAVCIAALDYGVDLEATGLPFIREVSPRLAPNMEALADRIRSKELPPELDLGGYFFKPHETSGGQFSRVQGADSSPVKTLRDALEMASWAVQNNWMTAAVATLLLKHALAANVDIRVTEPGQAQVMLRMPVRLAAAARVHRRT